MAYFDTRAILDYRQDVARRYAPSRPGLRRLDPALLAPEAARLVGSGDPGALLAAAERPHPEVLVFPLLRPDVARDLILEAEHFERWCRRTETRIQRPNGMHAAGVVLDDFGFEPMLSDLRERLVRPLAAELHADAGGASLDDHHGFVAAYDLEGQRHLDLHVDASDVTLNVCLGADFEGGALYFEGVRCVRCMQTFPRPDERIDVPQRPGHAILHRGKHRHRSRPIVAGARRNLILWCMSGAYRDRPAPEGGGCPPWCGRAFP